MEELTDALNWDVFERPQAESTLWNFQGTNGQANGVVYNQADVRANVYTRWQQLNPPL